MTTTLPDSTILDTHNCSQCGQLFSKDLYYKRVSRKIPNPDHCSDCKAVPVKQYTWNHPTLGRITCQPFQGELDDLWRPINVVGRLYMPGERVCGKKDCVNASHVVTVKLTAQPHETLLALVEAQRYDRKVRAR